MTTKMPTKTEIRKWIKEMVRPIIKPHSYKIGPNKEFGILFGIHKKTNHCFISKLIDITNDKKVYISAFSIQNLLLESKLISLTGNEEYKRSFLYYLMETHPYHKYIIEKDFSYRKPIETREQLEIYFQPLIDNFSNNLKLLNHYQYFPNLLKNWNSIRADVEKHNSDFFYSRFPSPYSYSQFLYISELLNDNSSSEIFKEGIKMMEAAIVRMKKKNNLRLIKINEMKIEEIHKVKTYFDNLSQLELEELKEEFKEFLTPPKTTIT